MSTESLQRAIDAVGGQNALAAKIGVKQSTLWYWLKHSKKGVPAEYTLLIERACGGIVKRQDLRPDLFASEAAQ